MSIGDFHKVAIRYEQGNIGLFIDGTKEGTFTGAWLFTLPLDNLSFDYDGDGDLKFFGKNKALAVYKEALTDANLRCLTYPNPVATTFDLDFDTIAEQFTFTRGSEATFVNEQGLIESTNQIGPELVTNGDFATDSDWTINDWNISGGTLNGSASTGIVYQNNIGVVVGKTYKVVLEISNYTSGLIRFKVGGASYQNIASEDGVQEFYFVASTTANNILFSVQSAYTGSIDNVSVKEVTTATNTPRLDYSTGAEAFLLEPQSTNLVPYSEDFSQWNLSSNASVNANQTISPDGTQNAYLLNSAQASSRVQVNLGNLTGVYAQSIYLKYAGDDVLVRIRRNQSNDRFDLIVNSDGITAGAVESGVIEYSIEAVGNDWYRVWNTQNNLTWYQIYIDANGNGGSIYAYGAQLEALPYASSYIPSNGSQTTRNQETCINATPVINSEEGTLYAEIAALANDSTFRMINISDGTLDNRVEISYSNTDNLMRVICYVNGVVVATKSNISANILNFNKIAFSYKENDFKAYLNGINVFTDTSGAIYPPNTLNRVDFGVPSVSGFDFFGNTKDLKYYPKALADVQLEALTSFGSFTEMANALNYTII